MFINLSDPQARVQLEAKHGEEIIPFLTFLHTAWLKRQRIYVTDLPEKWQQYDDNLLAENKLIRRYSPEGSPAVKIYRSSSLSKLIKKAQKAEPAPIEISHDEIDPGLLELLTACAVGEA